jgi:cell division protein ZapA (FtsZ GTPase activity inhibitor)
LSLLPWDGEDMVQVQLLGRTIRLRAQVDEAVLEKTLALVEETFRDMDRAYEIRWGCPPSALDTSTWFLMGALNLAHQVVDLEQEVSRHTQDLEQTLSKLLDDVPDELPANSPLFKGEAEI